MSLPSLVFVREVKLDNGAVDLYCFQLPADAIDDDGPTVVGTYKLVGKRTLRKVIQETKGRSKTSGPVMSGAARRTTR